MSAASRALRHPSFVLGAILSLALLAAALLSLVWTPWSPYDMDLARNEIFGPLVGLIRARDEAHALELANATEFGLSSAVFSTNLERAVTFARKVRAGMTHVNDIPVNDEANAPFGGEKNSGLGRFNGDWAIDEFTRDHWISVQHTPRHYPF